MTPAELEQDAIIRRWGAMSPTMRATRTRRLGSMVRTERLTVMCRHGHPRTAENTRWQTVDGKVYPECKTCIAIRLALRKRAA